MASQGLTVRLYLVDGTPTGLLTAEIMNWTGHVFVAPRSRLADALKRDEWNRTGVYFLMGNDPDQPSRERVYIGEGDNVSDRIKLHAKDSSKDFWSKVCIVTSKDQNLTKAHVRFLESRLVEITKSADRANLANGNEPGSKLLPESDVADMEYFLSQMQIVLPLVNFDFLRPQPTLPQSKAVPQDLVQTTGPLELVLASKKHKIEARAIEQDGEFTVLKGSKASTKSDFIWNTYQPMRDSLIKEGRLVNTVDPDVLEFKRDTVFPSPSAAASVIFNRNANGQIDWKVAGTRQTLKDYRDAQLFPGRADFPSENKASEPNE
ncbi:GIY-YIG nuclease family protein [Methylocapsa polymorpha]|uniref:GIY-YIG nuclease family protein n=1 Tax=Methylocapsa polymorpha TaxID=3080828 RepID=A0ABZ0HRV4_9HYPH|nr:GIY-YIG nuclease family protein [Methylocapsa sp. RX1]